MTLNMAHLAGVIDCAAILRTRDVRDSSQLPVVAIHGGSPAVLAYFAQATGTQVTITKRDYQRQPCATHCHESHTHVESTSARWSVTGSRATIMLHNVLPFLVIQRLEAQALLDIGLTVGWSSAVAEDMKRLGYKVPAMKRQPRARVA